MSIFWGQGFAQHPVSIINASKSLVCLSKVTCKVDHCLKCIFFTYWNEHISFPYSSLFNRDDHLTESCYVRGLDTVLHLFLGHFLSTIKTLTQDFNWEVRGNFLFSVENGVKVIEIILMSVRGKLNRKREQNEGWRTTLGTPIFKEWAEMEELAKRSINERMISLNPKRTLFQKVRGEGEQNRWSNKMTLLFSLSAPTSSK